MPLETTEQVLNNLSSIGCDEKHPEKGRDCLAFSSNEFRSATELFIDACKLGYLAIMKGLRCNVDFDTFGNVLVTLHGKTSRKIIITSHIDSVPKGGKYDGLVGVSGGMGAIKYLIDKGEIPNKTVQLIACRAEESSVTGQSCLGSLLATGQINFEVLKTLKYSPNGKSDTPLLDHIIQQTGLSEDEIKNALNNPGINFDEIDGAVEMHIEQSGVLERLGKSVGVVTGGIGSASRKEIHLDENRTKVSGRLSKMEVEGMANHSGGTPMNGEKIKVREGEVAKLNLRDDALVKALNKLSAIPGIRIHTIRIPNGSYNTVPGRCIVEYIEPGQGPDSIECISNDVSAAISRIIIGTEKIAENVAKETGGLARATIGDIKQENGKTVLYLDQRMLCEVAGAKLINQLEELVESQKSPEVNITTVQNGKAKPVKFEGTLKDELIEAYVDLFGEEPVQMSSMPGHDLSKFLTSRSDGSQIPGAMIYIRSLNNGISHNPNEYSSQEDINQATRLLCEFIDRIANQ